jgi:hypothetical protein
MSYNDAPAVGISEQLREARIKTYPQFVNLAEFLAQDMERPPELVSGLIHQATMTMIAAPPKSRKTWLLCQLAMATSSGAPFLGRETTQCRSLIINPEVRPEFLQSRLSAMANSLGGSGSPVDLRNIEVLNLRGTSFDVDGLGELLEAKAKDFGLICLDSLYQLLGHRDENSAGDIGNLLRCIDRVSASTGAAIVYTHHFAKGNAAIKDVLDRSSGSGVLGRYPDGIITMTPHKEAGVYTVDSVLRNFPPIDRFAVRFDYPLVTPADDVDPNQLKGKGGPPKKYDWLVTVNALQDGMNRADWQKKVIRKTKMSEGTFRSHLKQLIEQKLVQQYGKNQYRHGRSE